MAFLNSAPPRRKPVLHTITPDVEEMIRDAVIKAVNQVAAGRIDLYAYEVTDAADAALLDIDTERRSAGKEATA